MLSGPAGVGKRCAAAWLANTHLGVATAEIPSFPLIVPEHADLRWLRPAEDKATIGIDAVRALVGDLALTSYSGRGKVAVIEPADSMTASAANGLLKTLEEPRGNALLILVVDRAGRLPATIASRCQRIDIPLPPEHESLAWLDKVSRSDHWVESLWQGGNSPLRALEEDERREVANALGRDLAALSSPAARPVETAARWSRLDTDFVLEWLIRQVQLCIRNSFGEPRKPGAAVAESVAQRMDRRKLFCYLDMLWRIRSQAAGSFNVQLTLESLLIDWADGLRSCRLSNDSANMQLNFAR
jgi:DNA polymerase-3 subunit delta'